MGRVYVSFDAFPWGPWFVVWICAVASFLGPILVINFVHEIVRLRHNGIDRPLYVVMKRMLGVLSIPSVGNASVVGRKIFVAWDVRWTGAGETEGHIVGIDDATRRLEIALAEPVPILDDSASDIRMLTRVVFLPRNPRRAAYTFAAVHGTLGASPVRRSWTTAAVVLYPARTSLRR